MTGWAGEIEREKSPAISGRTGIEDAQARRPNLVPPYTVGLDPPFGVRCGYRALLLRFAAMPIRVTTSVVVNTRKSER